MRIQQKSFDELGSPSLQLEGLTIWVHGRQCPNSTSYWDANWVLVTVACTSSGSEVWVNGPILHLSEIAQWAVAAEQVSGTLQGEANLNCMEPELDVSMRINKRGQILMTVNISPDRFSEEHCFRFEIDQSYLPKLISECRSILDVYPIVSSAEA